MNAVVKQVGQGGGLMTMDQAEAVRNALKSSIYPGASDESVTMVLAYCQATGLDPMARSVHIVPMQVASGEFDGYGNPKKVKRDVIMPGIGKYRIDAARTNQYAGVSEPEYGPMLELKYKREQWSGPQGQRKKSLVDAVLLYPEWCRVTVTRIVAGIPCRFEAKEYWLENYAEIGDSGAPNPMWSKRPRGQLSKCAEAQALRKAFPETVSSQPTAEEMEGKELYGSTVEQQPDGSNVTKLTPRSKSDAAKAAEQRPAQDQAQDDSNVVDAEFTDRDTSGNDKPKDETASTGSWGNGVGDGPKKIILIKAQAVGMDESAVLAKYGVITMDRVNSIISELGKMAG